MLASRLTRTTLNFKSASVLFRNVSSQPKVGFFRRAARVRVGTETAAEGTLSDTPLRLGRGFLAGASAIGLGSLAFYGLGFSKEAGFIDRSSAWPEYVKERVRTTYQYFGSSLAITAASAVAVSRTPVLMNLAMKNSMLSLFLSFGAMIGSSMLVRSIPYESGTFGSKQLAWALHSGIIGGLIAPLTLLGGPLLMRAAWYTAGVVGGLSIVAATAPSEKFLNMTAPLSIGLGAVFAASVGGMFFPPTTRLGLSLYSISVYGGLVLFSMFLLYDTQKIVKKSEQNMHYDPVNESISIYMDTINIFIRIATILASGGNRRK